MAYDDYEDNEDLDNEDDIEEEEEEEEDPNRPRLQIIGGDGNAFVILGAVKRVMRQAKWPKEKQDEVMAKLTSGDYDNLLATCTEYFDVR